MKDFFVEMLEYTYHFNCELAKALTDTTHSMPDRPGSIFSHMLNAHNVWNTRIVGKGQHFGIWQLHQVADYKKIATLNHETSMEILSKRELAEIVVYSNTNGTEFRNSIRDMLFQVINHSTYHRGQLALLFREHGSQPLVTEYIAYKR